MRGSKGKGDSARAVLQKTVVSRNTSICSVGKDLSRVLVCIGPAGLTHVDGNLALLVRDSLIRSFLQQVVHDLYMTPHGGPMDRRVVSEIQRVHVGTLVDEVHDGLEVSIVRSSKQGRFFHDAALFDVCPFFQQELAHGQMPVPCSQEQGRITAMIPFVQRGSLLNSRSRYNGCVRAYFGAELDVEAPFTPSENSNRHRLDAWHSSRLTSSMCSLTQS